MVHSYRKRDWMKKNYVSLLVTVRGKMKRCVGENGERCEEPLGAK